VTRRVAWIWLLVTAGALLRAGYLVTPIMDSDQAVHGLQSAHLLGGEFGAFQWGLAYVGTPQAFLTALAFALFGVSRLVLNVVPLLVSLALIPVTYRLGREVAGEAGGLASATLVAVAPPYLAVFGAWARHGYVDTLVLGSLVLVLALRLGHRPLGPGAEARGFALLGLVAGLAFWVNQLSVFYLAPVALFLLLRDWRAAGRRGPWLAAGFFLLGSAPFWVFNLRHDFWSFRLFKGAPAARIPGFVLRVARDGLPALLGTRPTYGGASFVPGISEAVLVLYGLAFAWLVWRGLAGLLQGRLEPGVGLLCLFFTSAALLVGSSRQAELISVDGSKRYLLPLYSALPVLLAAFLVRVGRASRPLGVALLAVVLLLHLYGNAASYPASRGEVAAFREAQRQDARLVQFLRTRGLTRVYATEYRLAPRLTFDAGEAVIFAEPHEDRYPPYTALVDAAPRVAYLFDTPLAEPFAATLRAIGARFARTRIGPYEVFHDLEAPAGAEAGESLPPAGWRATASATGTPPEAVFDRDVDTGWFSGEPQRPGQFIEVDLGAPTPVQGVTLLSPRPSIGFPIAYRVTVSADGRAWHETAAVPGRPWSLHWRDGQPRMGPPDRVTSVFAPRPVRHVRVEQTGSHPRWHWAVGELFVHRPAAAGDDRGLGPHAADLERAVAAEAAGRLAAAAREYWRLTREAPEREALHARLAGVYDRAGVPLEGAAPPGVRARALERLGLWARAAREHAIERDREEARLAPHARSGPGRRLARALHEAGDAARARELEAALARDFAPAVAAAASFGDGLRLLGYRLEPGAIAAGRPFRLTYYWEARRAVPAEYTVFVHLVRAGRVGLQHDHAPLDGRLPTTEWEAGEVVRESYELTPPPTLAPGRYDVVVGLWDPRTGERLPVGDTALEHRKDRVVVGTVEVHPAS
jgi:4-amino-4-deoxy-L-arabinose transferase-like glycosyltransferase